jgi:hypothetical protein
MNYLDKYDNFVMKKCLDTRRVNTFELNNLANGRVTKSHFGGYVAQKPLSTKDLVIGLSNHGFNSKEVLKGLDIDALLLEINQAGVQIEQILGDGDDLGQMFADLPVYEEDSHTPLTLTEMNVAHTLAEMNDAHEPDWLSSAGNILYGTPESQLFSPRTQTSEAQTDAAQFLSPRTQTPEAQTSVTHSEARRESREQARRGSRFFNMPNFHNFVNILRSPRSRVASSSNDAPEYVSDSDVSQGTGPDLNTEYQAHIPNVAHPALGDELQRNVTQQQRDVRQIT